MFENFLCRVANSGVPHEIEHVYGIPPGVIINLTAKEMCQLYWLLQYVYIDLRVELDSSIIIFDNAKLGDEILFPPRTRIVKVPEFRRNYTDSMYSLCHNFEIDFSKIYFSDDDKFSVDFRCEIYDSGTSREESSILLSFARDAGNCRDLYISREFEFFGEMHTVYLNYQSGLWNEVNFTVFNISNTLWER